MFHIKSPEFETSLYLKEGDLELGERKLKIQVLLTPGHSPGSISLYVPEKKLLITGDVVFYGSVGRTDFPGGNTQQLRESIERLSLLDTYYIIPGHSTEMGCIVEGKKNIEQNFQAIKLYF